MPNDPVGELPRFQFSLKSMFVMMAIAALLLSMIPTAVMRARENARRTRCVDNLKQWGLSLHNYHTAYESFPYLRCGTGFWCPPGKGLDQMTILPNSNADQLSGWAPLTPYIGSNPLYFQIVNGTGSPRSQPWGPAPDLAANPVWSPFAYQFTCLLCPSDDGGRSKPPNSYGRNNYVFCLGDSISNNDFLVPYPVTGEASFPARDTDTAHYYPVRGIFGWHSGTRIADIRDGTSYTIAVSERAVATDPRSVQAAIVPEKVDEYYSPSTCLAYVSPVGKLTKPGAMLSGLCWVNGHACFVGFTTCLPPNSPSCGLTTQPAGYSKGGSGGIYSASSYHPGGVNCLFADGAVHFISNNIDTGDLTLSEATPFAAQPGKSPTPLMPNQPSRWGVWGALGSIAGGEQVDSF